MNRDNLVTVEVSGGNVQSVWAPAGIEVVVIDWDNILDPDYKAEDAGLYPTHDLAEMEGETLDHVEAVLKATDEVLGILCRYRCECGHIWSKVVKVDALPRDDPRQTGVCEDCEAVRQPYRTVDLKVEEPNAIHALRRIINTWAGDGQNHADAVNAGRELVEGWDESVIGDEPEEDHDEETEAAPDEGGAPETDRGDRGEPATPESAGQL